MRKLVFVIALTVFSITFMSCKQEVIQPYEPDAPIEQSEPDVSGELEEGSGVKGS